MNKEKVIELYRQNRAILEKTAFMLITAATASIAYILTQIKDDSWNDVIWLAIFLLFLLGCSFIIGCFHLSSQARLLNANAQILQPEIYKENLENIFDNLEDAFNKSEIFGRWQFLSFIFGAVFYALYVLLKLYFQI